jgi:hypothetical protein
MLAAADHWQAEYWRASICLKEPPFEAIWSILQMLQQAVLQPAVQMPYHVISRLLCLFSVDLLNIAATGCRGDAAQFPL